jgi:hypothetical protein
VHTNHYTILAFLNIKMDKLNFVCGRHGKPKNNFFLNFGAGCGGSSQGCGGSVG